MERDDFLQRAGGARKLDRDALDSAFSSLLKNYRTVRCTSTHLFVGLFKHGLASSGSAAVIARIVDSWKVLGIVPVVGKSLLKRAFQQQAKQQDGDG